MRLAGGQVSGRRTERQWSEHSGEANESKSSSASQEQSLSMRYLIEVGRQCQAEVQKGGGQRRLALKGKRETVATFEYVRSSGSRR